MPPLDRPSPGTNIVPPSQLTAFDPNPEDGSYPGGWPVMPGYVGCLTVGHQHIDEFGHVNNLVYPTWALEAAWHHSTILGFPFSKFAELGTGFVVWNHSFDFLAPLIAGDEVLVATWIAANDGRMRLTRAYEMRHATSDKPVFRGQTLFISIDMKSGKPCRMPLAFKDGYQTASPTR